MKALDQFRKEESELFDSETGEFYTGTIISPRQCELMRDSIDELDRKLSLSIAKTAQLVQELIEVKESKEALVKILNSLYEDMGGNNFKDEAIVRFTTKDHNVIKKAINKAKQS